jgi:hypothetical protein
MNWVYESFRLFFSNIRAGFSFVRGLYWISYLKTPIITIFGGHHAGLQGSYLESAHAVAFRCVEQGS